ncbi:monocarboxylate transporter 12-like [Pollicipes pollicipes]|uniref:monocarboxylate transporter 12-like n=1 Tax=Pollicipes pollicipes TaxID=41117 RepID=UPI001884D66D|nr:monocarboxylate transporter 12-like [Pollicipes pollicipes]
MKSFGLIMLALMRDRGLSAAQAVTILGIFLGIQRLGAPLAALMCRRLSERHVALLGSLCCTLGLGLSALADVARVLYLTNGVLFGTGLCLCMTSSVIILQQYFDNRRGLATGIMAASFPVGGVVFPPLINLLLNEFGMGGTYLLLCGLLMHMFVSSMLYRPPHTQRMIMRLDRKRLLRKKWKTPDTLCTNKSHSERQHLPVSQDIQAAVTDSELSCAANGSPAVAVILPPAVNGRWAQLSRMLDLKLLADPLFLSCTFWAFMVCIGFPHMNMLLPSSGSQEIKMSRDRMANMVAFMAPIEFVSSLAFGAVLDRRLFHKRYGCIITSMVGGTAALAMVFVRSSAGLYVFAALGYMTSGFILVVVPLLLVEFYGEERISSASTLCAALASLASMTSMPLGGLLREATGSHRPVFAVISACVLSGGLSVLLHPIIIPAPPLREHLRAEDVHVLGDSRTEAPGPGRDLALLAACSHTVFNYGAYGFLECSSRGGPSAWS